MIALVVVGVMAAAVAPSLGAVLADNRQASAGMDLVRLARRARARAISTSVAQLLRYRRDASNQLGVIDLFSGMSPRCGQTPWAAAFAAAANNPLAAVEIYDMALYNPINGVTAPTSADAGRHIIRLVFGEPQPVPLSLAGVGGQICYQPNGETYLAAGITATTFTRQTWPITFTITRTMDGTAFGTPRIVVFPAGGTARLR